MKRKKLAGYEKQIGDVRATWVTETVSMASVPPDPVPLLVSLKAVDPAEYPYYGAAELEPQMSLQQALQGDSAIVADEFLIRLNAHVGIRFGSVEENFKITAVLKQEPDRMTRGCWIRAAGDDFKCGAGRSHPCKWIQLRCSGPAQSGSAFLSAGLSDHESW